MHITSYTLARILDRPHEYVLRVARKRIGKLSFYTGKAFVFKKTRHGGYYTLTIDQWLYIAEGFNECCKTLATIYLDKMSIRHERKTGRWNRSDWRPNSHTLLGWEFCRNGDAHSERDVYHFELQDISCHKCLGRVKVVVPYDKRLPNQDVTWHTY